MIEEMQQTNKYELNKPGLDDPVAIAPLNENMDKLEAALIAEAKSRADADAAEANARTAAIQAEAAARVSAVNAEISARTAAVNTEATARANADTAETNARNAAIQAEANTRASADTTEANTRAAADNALSTRIQALEAKHIAYGTVNAPNSQDVEVTLPFTPYAVLTHYCHGNNALMAVTGQNGYGVQIVTNGFKLSPSYSNLFGKHNYIAFG